MTSRLKKLALRITDTKPTKQDGTLEALYAQHPPLKAANDHIAPRVAQRRAVLRGLTPKQGTGAEIGVFTGSLSRVLIDLYEPERFYLVDGWSLLFGRNFPAWGPYTDHGRLETGIAKEAARRQVAHIGDRAEIVEARALDWLAGIPDAHLDWAYLDASHAYDATLAELEAIAPKLKPSGIIVCDDCTPHREGRHHGVFRAVRDFTRRGEFEIFHLSHVQGCLRRSEI